MALTLLLTTGLLSQAAFAQTTYVITDGDRVLVHTTYETDPAEVLSEAGLELGAEDTFTAQTDGGVSAITVNRIQLVRVQNGGEELEVATYGSTVSGILEQLGISTEGELRISQDLDAQTYDGMVIDVVYLRTETRQYIRTEPYDTVYCTDSTLEPGAEKILTPGRNGSILCTAEIIYENGVEISRSVLREKVLYTPVNALVARGIDRSSKEQEGGVRQYLHHGFRRGDFLQPKADRGGHGLQLRRLYRHYRHGHHGPVRRHRRGPQRHSLRNPYVHRLGRRRLHLRLRHGGGLRRRHSRQHDRPVFQYCGRVL